MYLVIIYEVERMLCAIAMKRAHEMAAYENLAQLKEYLKKNPIRTVVGVSMQEDGSYDLYSLKTIRQLDVQLLKATTQTVLNESARTMRYDDLIIISKSLDGNRVGNKALDDIYKKNLKNSQNRKYTGFHFVAEADNFKLMEAISYARGR